MIVQTVGFVHLPKLQCRIPQRVHILEPQAILVSKSTPGWGLSRGTYCSAGTWSKQWLANDFTPLSRLQNKVFAKDSGHLP